jgi:hypothetical protein
VVMGDGAIVQSGAPVHHSLRKRKVSRSGETRAGSKQPAHASEGYQDNNQIKNNRGLPCRLPPPWQR